MAKNLNKQEHEMRRESRNFQRGNTSKQRTELADALLSPADQIAIAKQFAGVTVNVLKEEFGSMCDIKLIETPSGYFKICMNKEGVEKKSTSQIEITVTRKGKYNIHLNDYDHYSEYYYFGDKLVAKDLMNELDNFKGFLEGKPMPVTSKLTKEEYYTPEDEPEDAGENVEENIAA
ncbi:MAG: hypothetical protein NT085_02420 [candidate division SR1 bacterium]|nr:hypothetical protein [candidate division SR1 bacterium]